MYDGLGPIQRRPSLNHMFDSVGQDYAKKAMFFGVVGIVLLCLSCSLFSHILFNVFS